MMEIGKARGRERTPQGEAMKKQNFSRIGITEREADRQLWWTLSWAVLTLAVSIVSIFQP
jgi:hypothetical protein